MSAETIGHIDGRPVTVWNTAAAGPPSNERVRSSIDEAHAALNAYSDKRDRDHIIDVLFPGVTVNEVEG